MIDFILFLPTLAVRLYRQYLVKRVWCGYRWCGIYCDVWINLPPICCHIDIYRDISYYWSNKLFNKVNCHQNISLRILPTIRNHKNVIFLINYIYLWNTNEYYAIFFSLWLILQDQIYSHCLFLAVLVLIQILIW